MRIRSTAWVPSFIFLSIESGNFLSCWLTKLSGHQTAGPSRLSSSLLRPPLLLQISIPTISASHVPLTNRLEITEECPLHAGGLWHFIEPIGFWFGLTCVVGRPESNFDGYTLLEHKRGRIRERKRSQLDSL